MNILKSILGLFFWVELFDFKQKSYFKFGCFYSCITSKGHIVNFKFQTWTKVILSCYFLASCYLLINKNKYIHMKVSNYTILYKKKGKLGFVFWCKKQFCAIVVFFLVTLCLCLCMTIIKLLSLSYKVVALLNITSSRHVDKQF